MHLIVSLGLIFFVACRTHAGVATCTSATCQHSASGGSASGSSGAIASGTSSSGGAPTQLSVQGSIAGLTSGSLTLGNAGETQIITAGTSTFSFAVNAGDAYAVTVLEQPENLSCGVIGGAGSVGASSISGLVVSCLGVVRPLYVAAPNWLDWVKSPKGLVTPDAADAQTCAGTEQGWRACIPAGERRAVDVPGLSDCSTWSAADSLQDFDWVCQAAADHLTFSSTGLNADHRLSDLIDFTATNGAFFTNQLILNSSTGDALQTPATIWWNDAFPSQGPPPRSAILITAPPNLASSFSPSLVPRHHFGSRRTKRRMWRWSSSPASSCH